MIVQLLSQITFLLLPILMFSMAPAAAAELSLAMPGCPDSCGKIRIPYPFGIGSGCYMDEWFAIDCNETFYPPKTFLIKINIELINISLSGSGRIRVKSPIISSNCSGRESSEGVNLTGSPFSFSDHNYFLAVGCNNQAVMVGTESQIVGCKSTCKEGKIDLNSCNGLNHCCWTFVPSNLQVFNATLDSIDGSKRESGCKLAFVADDMFTYIGRDPYSVQNMRYVPVMLDWYIKNSTTYLFEKNNETTSCPQKSDGVVYPNEYSSEYSFRCHCQDGYEGNPYLLDGCQDIDECMDQKHANRCEGWGTCVNLPGHYKCEARKSWIIVLSVGVGFGLLLLLTSAWRLYIFLKKRKIAKLKKRFFKRNGGLLLQQQISSIEGNVEKTKVFSSKELEMATDHFNKNRILGQGGQGTVYKGMLVDGRIVAVKKSKIVDEEKLEEFINEVVILSQINHRNVVTLLGCCLETEVPLLVYEFISNGTLFQYLHDQNEEFPLSWEMRLRIATEVAGALFYLHSAASIPIYHRDIKSTNILLDEKYRAKVSDFGNSRSIAIDQTHLTTVVHGTIGYLDPLYFRSSHFTENSDVYSFGVVLVELVTGKKPTSLIRSNECGSLTEYFIHSMKENRLFDILDDRIMQLHYAKEEIMAVANLAKRCLSMNEKKRPTMKEVATELEGIRLSLKDSNVPQNHEEIESVTTEFSYALDVVSPLGYEYGTTSSLDVTPLVSNRTW